jgi:hypothetical protein
LKLAALLLATLLATPAAAAERTWEIEPHLVFGAAAPWYAGGYGGGLGVRGAVTMGSFGVSTRVRDTIALSFGADFVRAWGGSPYGDCIERTPGPAGTSVCTRVDAPGAYGGYYLLAPVVARWTLDLAPPFAFFIEPGVAIFVGNDHGGAAPSFAIGGRYRLTQVMDAVLRLGWPASTIGLAF